MSNWIVEALIASSLLMLLVLVIRKPVAAQFGPRVAYWLWLLPALRMVMPPLPQGWALRPAEQVQDIAFDIAPDAAIVATDVAQASYSWALIIVAIWAAGAIAHFGLHLWAYRRFAARAKSDAVLVREVDPGAIRVFATAAVNGPLAMGLTQPTILVPRDFEWRFDAQEREYAIAHEVAHHRRGDLKVNLGALAILSLHWFNPLAHAAYRAFRTDQELACDATIMAAADSEERHAYGRALVKSACDRAPMIACALNRKQELKRRLKMMRFGQLSLVRGVVATTLGFGLIAGSLLVTASVGASAAAETQAVRFVQQGIDEGGSAMADAVSAEIAQAEDEARLGDAEAQLAEDEAKQAEAQANAAEIEARRSEAEADREDKRLAQIEASAATEEARHAAREAREKQHQAYQSARESHADAMQAHAEAQAAHREAMREAIEAQREAMNDARDAQRDAEQDVRDAQQDLDQAIRDGNSEGNRAARAALVEAQRTLRTTLKDLGNLRFNALPALPTLPAPPTPPTPPAPPSAAKSCKAKGASAEAHAIVRTTGGTHQIITSYSDCKSRQIRISQMSIDKNALAALKAARHQIKTMPHLNEAERRAALRNVDAEISRLSAKSN